MTEQAFTTADLIARDRWDRPLIVPPGKVDPVPYTRASTLAGTFKNANGLITWKARHTALGIARHRDLAAMAAPLEYGDPNLDGIIETACDRSGMNAKANYGTAVHSHTENSRDVPVHVDMAADVAAYRELLNVTGIEMLTAEEFVVCDQLKAAGTLDHIATVPKRFWPDMPHDLLPVNGRVVVDKKTGGLHFSEHAIQLAVYAHGSLYDPTTHRREDVNVSQRWALLIHIPRGEGKAVAYWVDILAGWDAALMATEVMEWRKRDDLAQMLVPTPDAAQHEPGKPYTADNALYERRQKLTEAIELAVSEAALTALYRARKDIWTDEHTVLAKARKAMIQGGLR